MYNSKLLFYLTHRTVLIYHACNTVLTPCNRFKHKFSIKFSKLNEDALFHLNFDYHVNKHRNVFPYASMRVWNTTYAFLIFLQRVMNAATQHQTRNHNARTIFAWHPQALILRNCKIKSLQLDLHLQRIIENNH